MLRRLFSPLQRRRDADASSRAEVKRYARRAVQQRHDALAVRRGYDDIWPGARLGQGERAEECAVAPFCAWLYCAPHQQHALFNG